MEKTIENALKVVFSRIIDAEGIEEYEAKRLSLIYIDLAGEDPNSKISVKMMKQFLEEVVRPNSDKKVFEKVMSYYDFRSEKYSKKKMIKLHHIVESFWNQFKTMENAYMYSYGFREMVNKLAPKLWVNGEMSPIEKVKWLRVWIVLVRDQHFFWLDTNKKGDFISKVASAQLNNVRIQPEIMINLEEFYFSYMDKGNVILDMLQQFIATRPEEVQEKIREYGEFDFNGTNSQTISCIRKIKLEMFPKQWIALPAYFFTVKGIKMLTPEKLQNAIEAYQNGGVEKLETLDIAFYDIKTYSKKYKKCYKVKGNFYVSCQEELEMYVTAYKWLLENPEFKFGEENKTLAEYNLADLLVEKLTYEELIKKWSLDANYVRDSEDINFELLKKVVSPEEYGELLLKYHNQEVSLDEINQQIGLKDDYQGMLLASKTVLLPEKNFREFQDTIKRVVRFGIQNCKKSDSIYLEIFRDMLKKRPQDLPKGMANLYRNRV